MKDKFFKFINLQGKYLTSLLLLLAMSVGNVWAGDCDGGTTIFSLVVNSQTSKTQIQSKKTLNVASYATLNSGSTATLNNTASSNYDAITTTPSVTFKNSGVYMEATFSCELAKGDVIIFVKGAKSKQMQLAASADASTKAKTTDYQYVIPTGSPLIGESKIYVWGYDGGEGDFGTMRIVRPYTITLTAGDGATCSASSVGCVPSGKVILPHAFKSGMHFKGWYTASTGGTKVNNYYTASSDVELFAQFEEFASSGMMFSCEMADDLKPAANCTIRNATVDLLTYAVVDGGSAEVISGDGNHVIIMSASPQITIAGSTGKIHVVLDFALQNGDEIATDFSAKTYISKTSSSSTPFVDGTNQSYIVTDGDGLKEATELYFIRQTNSTVSTITITRPAAAATYSVTYDLNGGTGADAPTQADVEEGSSFTVASMPSGVTAPTGKKFYKWSDGTNEYAAGDSYTMGTSDVTLTAVWVDDLQDPTATFADGTYILGGPSLNMAAKFESNSTGAVTYSLKEATANASITEAGVFTATVAGEYVVVANQAAQAGTYAPISKEATVTVLDNELTDLFIWKDGSGFGGDGKCVSASAAGGSKNANQNQAATTLNYSSSTLTGMTSIGRPSEAGNVTLTIASEQASFAIKSVCAFGKIEEPNGIEYSWDNTNWTAIAGGESTDKKYEFNAPAATFPTALYIRFTNAESGKGGLWLRNALVTLEVIKMVSGTSEELQTVKVNGTAIDAADLATLKSEKSLAITTTYTTAPTVTFVKRTTTNYDGGWPASVVDTEEEVTATDATANWSASRTINAQAYTVTLAKPAGPSLETEATGFTLTSAKIAKDEEVFTFSGANLEGNVTIALESAVAGMTVSPVEVAPTAGAITDQEVTITYKSLADVAEANVNLIVRYSDEVKLTIPLTYSSTAGVEDITPISTATTWNWTNANSATEEVASLDANAIVVLANYSGWVDAFKANSIAGKLQYVYRGNNYAQGHSLKFNTTIPGRVKVKFSNTSTKSVARAPRITDANGTYAPTDEADGSKNATAIYYSHNVAAGDVLIEGFEMQDPIVLNMLRFYEVEFKPTYTVSYAANGGSGDMTDANAYVAGDEVTLLANTFTPATGFVWSGWTVKDANNDDVAVSEGKFTMPASNVTVTAQWDDASKVAVIVETSAKYESLADAVAAATDGQTIQLLQNNNVTAQVEVAEKAITLDLAGYKIEYTGTSTLPSGVILVHNGASLTIDDSSDPDAGSIVSGEKAYAAIALTKAGDDAANPAVLVINGGIFTGYYYGITGNGSRPNTQITINGGTITATATNDNLGIYHPQNGTLTINGGTITAYSAAVEMRAGELEINGGVFTATALTFSCNPNGSGTTTVGAAIAIAQHTTKVDIAVTINGGTFNGEKAINESNPQVNDPAPQVAMAVTDGEFNGAVSTVDVDRFISGGTFVNPVPAEQCAEGFVPAPQDPVTGKYSVEPKDGVSIIKAVATATAQDITGENLTGILKGAAHIETSSSYKLNTGKYFMVQLKEGENFQAGDIVKIKVSAVNDCNGFAIFKDASFTSANLIIDTHDATGTAAKVSSGINEVKLPSNYTGSNKLYVGRASSGDYSDQNLNAGINQIEVVRVIYPTLTAITIDGRAGVIDEANKTVAVQIPYESVLSSLTVVPTVIRNEAHATTPQAVISNEGAWIEGANTYRVMDKDGDYTDYTITLTRDVLKHTVRFMDGISEFASDLVEDGENPSAPATEPEKEDYLFQGWSATVDGDVITDWTAFTITEDKNFYAIWASDGAINLVNKTTGAIDTEHFITGVSAAEVNSEKAAAWTNTQGTFAGINNLTKLVQYNATTTQTKVKVKLYSTNNSPKEVYLHKIVEGETTSVVETIAVASKTPVETEYYVFNDTKNRSIYLATNSTDVKILQVKVIESGDALPMFGQAGYSLNLNKGRIASAKDVDMTFEGMSYQISSAYGVIGSTEFKVKSATGNPYKMTFVVTSPVTMTVTESGSNYYVYKVVEPEDKGTANAAGTKEYELTAGTWIIESATSSEAKFTNIAFALPKCEAPVFENTLADIELCIGEAIPAIDGTATVSDGGDVTYKWYEEGSETVLATTATYTPTADGSYFVVATNSLAGHQDVSTTSDVISVAHFASVAITTAPEDVYKHTGLDATLSVVATGKNLTYEWFTCDDELGNNPVAIVPAETAADLNLTAIESGIKYYQVVVTDECGTSASAVAKVEGFDDIALQDVTGNMTWDFSKANDGTAAGSNLCNEAVLVNVSGIVNNSDFKSDNIMATANKFASGKLQASMIKFHATVPGAIEVKFANTGTKSDYRYLIVNGRTTASGSKNADVVTYRCFVPAGDVVLTVTTANDGNMFNFTSVAFDATVEMQRTESWIAPGELGTICYPNGYVVGGADVYEMVGVNEYGKFVFDEVDELKPGKPYLFCATSYGPIDFYQTAETAVSNPVNEGNMKGTFEDMYIQTSEANKYYFTGTKFYAVSARSTELLVPANRCYVDLNDPQPAPQAAPGRRRVVFDAQGSQVATGIDDVQGDNVQSTKVLIDGELFILRGENMYDATGRLVK